MRENVVEELNEVTGEDKQPNFLRSVYFPVALFLLGMLGICLMGSNAANQRAADALVPDVVKTYHNCEYLGESTVMIRGVSFDYLSTSCKTFDKPITDFGWEKGKNYEIEVTDSKTKGTYISKVTPSK